MSGIPMTTSSTLGLGTAILFSLNYIENISADAEQTLTIVHDNQELQQTQFKQGLGIHNNIGQEDKNLIQKSNILKLLQAINVDKNEFLDESVEKEFVCRNKKHNTIMVYKKFNTRTTCALIHRIDTESNSYYPSYYLNKESALKLHKYLENKYSINHDNVVDLIIFTEKEFLGDSLYRVWRVSPDYDSFLHKLGINRPKPKPKPITFVEPPEGITKISPYNDHFKSFEIVNALNDCLNVEDEGLFDIESHYGGVYTEYLHFAKQGKDILYGEHYIMGTRIDHILTHKDGAKAYNHTYVERKSTDYQESMSSARNQCLRYISINKKWPSYISKVYGINTIGLNLEFNEYKLGSKGLVNIENKYINRVNNKVEMYSIISDKDLLEMELEYKVTLGKRGIKGTTNFSMYKEYGALNNKQDS